MDAAVRQRPRLVPSSTYRLQVYRGFTLHAAREIAAYLGQLGIGAAYTSPYFAAQPGTTHGYDVSNHNEVNVEVGGIDALAAFTDTLREHDLQHIVDFVPNHMGIATSTNPWWRDVLENGPSARAGRFFDIDWFPVKRELRRKLLLPILGISTGVCSSVANCNSSSGTDGCCCGTSTWNCRSIRARHPASIAPASTS